MTTDYEALFSAWITVTELADGLLDPIDTPEQHAAALQLLEEVWEAKEERPELGSLLSMLVESIHTYEKRAFPPRLRTPGEVLAGLMAFQQLSVPTLAQAIGISPEELGRLLDGEQVFNRDHIHLFARHLHVIPEVFL